MIVVLVPGLGLGLSLTSYLQIDLPIYTVELSAKTLPNETHFKNL